MAGAERSLWFVTDIETAPPLLPVPLPAGIIGSRGAEDTGGGFGSGLVREARQALTRRVEIGADDLKREVGRLLAVVGDVFDQAESEAGLSLEEVELTIEVSSEGQVSILGSGGKIGGSGGIKLSFKRRRAGA